VKLRSKTSSPRIGDKVWNQERLMSLTEDQPNGYICLVIWDDREVVVRYHDNRGTTEVMSWDDLDGNWTDKFGGTYILYAG